MSKVNVAELKNYYEEYFPFELMFQWLCYGDEKRFENREFSFTIEDVYFRYKCFSSAKDFKDSVLNMKIKSNMNSIVNKIDIGAIFSVSPNDMKTVSTSKFQAVEKEFILDIDMTDYDNVRFCGCKEAKVCCICWQLMSCAIKVLEYLLRDVFGCEHLLWVFSGRRGVHCWVCDEDIRKLNNVGRSAMADFMQLYGDKKTNRINVAALNHPSFDESSPVFLIAERYFVEIYGERFFDLSTKSEQEGRDIIAPLITVIQQQQPDLSVNVLSALRDALIQKCSTGSGGGGGKKTIQEQWIELKYIIQQITHLKGQNHNKRNYGENNNSLIASIVYAFVYPRLDINVSKQLNHLLKSPFCVHPSTGNICVPIDPRLADNFDIMNPPNVSFPDRQDFKMGVKLFENFVKSITTTTTTTNTTTIVVNNNEPNW